jgi:hypothetical protein
MALCLHPAGRIGVPLMFALCKCAQAGFDVLPTALVIERSTQSLSDEGAAAPPSDTVVKLLNEVVL